jgi:hypothetical protein
VLVSTYETFSDPGINGGPTVSYTSQTDMSYDNHLNITRLYKNPNTSVPGLDRTTTYSWAVPANGGETVWSYPSTITVYKGATPSLANMTSNTVFTMTDCPMAKLPRGT